MSEISGARPGRRRSIREERAHEQQRQRQIAAGLLTPIEVSEWNDHLMSEAVIEQRDEERA